MATVISLGAGVQSSTLLLMAAAGEFDVVPELAIFADTGHEPQAVYDHLDWLRHEVTEIEVVRVQEMDLREVALSADFNPIPLFMRNENGGSIGRRQCTKVAKLYPIRHELRRRGFTKVEQWLGISIDEVERMKPANVKWVEHRWPLVEREMTRHDCKRWLTDHGYPIPPKSACVFCPYHSAEIWRDMRDNDPESWNQAVTFDRAMNERGEYLHSSMVPLDQVDLSTPEDRGQLALSFADECEGMCGV